MVESLLTRTDWENKHLFQITFMPLLLGMLAGYGFFYIDTLILANSYDSGLFFALLISMSASMSIQLTIQRNLAYKLDRKEDDN